MGVCMNWGDRAKDKTCTSCGRIMRHIGKIIEVDVYSDDSAPEGVEVHVVDGSGFCYDCATGGPS